MRTDLSRWRIVPVFALVLLLALPVGPALGQDAGAVISLDWPGDGQSAALGQNVVFGGWAAEWSAAGTGIDRVAVYDAPMTAGGQIVAEAVYGAGRTDVAAAYGPAWLNSEFTATWRATGATGNRTFWVYAHSMDDDGWTNKTVTIRLTPATEAVAPAPLPAAVQPTPDNRNQAMGQNPYMQQNQAMGQNPYMQQNPNDYRQPMPGQYGQQMAGQYPQMQGPYGQYPQYGPQYAGQFASPYGPNGMPFTGQFNGLSGPAGAQPVSVTVAGQNANSVSLSWTPIPMPGITGYQTWQSLAATGPFTPSVVSGSGATGATVQGLTPNTTYYFQVAAVTNNAPSTPSAVVSAATTL
jgi:hypothetical protein